MDDTIRKMVDRGWIEMSIALDEKMPVVRVSHMRRYRNYYSAAMVMILIFATYILMNESSIVISPYHGLSADNLIQSEAVKERKIKVKQEIVQGIANAGEGSVYESDYIEDRVNKRSKYRQAHVTYPLIINRITEQRSNNDFLLNSIIGKIGNRLNDFSKSSSVTGSEMPLGPEDNFRHNTVSVMVNSINEDLLSFGGVDGGINYAYRLNKNIGFMTGIEHSLLAMATNNSEIPDIMRGDPVFRSYAENIEISDEANPSASNELFYYVGIPVGFLYSISDFTISAGMKFSYLVNTPDILSGIENPEFERIMSDNKLSGDFSNIVYNRFDYSFILGFEFQIFRDFSLISRLNYSHSNLVNSYSYGENEIGNLFMVSGLENNIRDKLGRNMYFGIGVKYDLARR